jgi:hypothetical protein
MSFSDLENALFGDDDHDEDVQLVAAPEYTSSEEFKAFRQNDDISVDEAYGYI